MSKEKLETRLPEAIMELINSEKVHKNMLAAEMMLAQNLGNSAKKLVVAVVTYAQRLAGCTLLVAVTPQCAGKLRALERQRPSLGISRQEVRPLELNLLAHRPPGHCGSGAGC